jgi:hypothetical protein
MYMTFYRLQPNEYEGVHHWTVEQGTCGTFMSVSKILSEGEQRDSGR